MTVTKELRAAVREHRQRMILMNGIQVPGSIPFLRERIVTSQNPQERDDLLAELAGEYLRAELEDEHLLVQRERLANQPEAAVRWLGLADSLITRNDSADEAKAAVAKALEISRRTGTLIRYSLLCQAEIARRTGDAVLFEETIKELIADAGNVREEDCELSGRFLIDIPEGFCSRELEMKFRSLLNDASEGT